MPQRSGSDTGGRGAPPHSTGVPSAARSAHLHSLFEENNRALVSYLTTKLHSQSEARDVAQEAYVRLLQLDRPDAVGFLRAYLFRIAGNIAVDRLRRRSVRERSAPDVGMLFEQLTAQPGPERAVLGEQQLATVKSAIKALPAKCRRAFLLHFFQDRSVAEIATMLGLTQRMVRYHVARALAHCKMALDAED